MTLRYIIRCSSAKILRLAPLSSKKFFMQKVFTNLTVLLLLALAGWLIVGLSLQESGSPADNSGRGQGGFVIETEVDGPQDCTKLEKYDPERKVCFIECDTQKECGEKEAELDAELESLDFAQGAEPENKNFEKLIADDKETQALIDNALAVYSIEPGEKYTLLSGKENKKAKQIKELVRKILPTDVSDKHVDKLVLMFHKDKDGLAFVTPSKEGDNRVWSIFVNMNSGSDKKELIFTLVHEFGHILFLNDEELSPKDMCNGYLADEGCADNSTILGRFYSAFWKGKFDPKAGADENFTKDEFAFVDDYAATNPVEDLAESFAYFVLKPKPANPQAVRDKKILFFYKFPELVKLRAQIRRELARVIK